MEALQIFGTMIGHAWEMLAFTVPGLGVTCQQFVIALLIISISLSAIHFVFGLGGDGTGYRSGQSDKKHISPNRKDDQY